MKLSTTTIMAQSIRKIALASVLTSPLVLSCVANAAVHGISGGTGTLQTFNLTATAATISQPDGASIYSWGYGCSGVPAAFLPAADANAVCPAMQMPGPTMIVHQGDTVTVNLHNGLPLAAGTTSIVFPGITVAASNGVSGPLTREAAIGGDVVYQFTAPTPGTYAYYSGSQPDVQIEMGMFGAIIVLPNANGVAAAKCSAPAATSDQKYSLALSAYGHSESCYNREYLFEFSELNSRIHDEVKLQVDACTASPCAPISVTSEPYRPNYYMVNGRSMPDDMDVAYSTSYPNQPYNGNPHMHPGELVLMRVIGQGRWQHPFHFHGNHARVLARDANMLLEKQATGATTEAKLAGPILFTIPTVSGQTVDAIFTWTGQGLNWDVYGTQPHTCNGRALPAVPGAKSAQTVGFDSKTHEYCLDHGKPIPATPPDPSIVVNGQWYGGTPYIGLQAANPTPEAPGTLNQNPEAGYAYMWHSHNEREITTNDVFPGGMMMMLLIDPTSWVIDETL